MRCTDKGTVWRWVGSPLGQALAKIFVGLSANFWLNIKTSGLFWIFRYTTLSLFIGQDDHSKYEFDMGMRGRKFSKHVSTHGYDFQPKPHISGWEGGCKFQFLIQRYRAG